MAKYKDLTATDSQYHTTREYYALATGGETWREHLTRWLPRHPAEGMDRWEYRLSLATYSPDLPPLLTQIVSSLLASPLSWTTDPAAPPDGGAMWADIAADMDGDGSSLTSVAYAAMTDGLIAGRGMMLVTAGDPMPVVSVIPAKSILRAGISGKTVYWMIVDDGKVTPDVANSAAAMVRQIRYIDGEGTDYYHIPIDARVPAPDDEIPVAYTVPHGVTIGGNIAPVVPLIIPPGSHALRILADTAVALVRARAHLTWALTQSAYPLLVIRSDIPMDRPRIGAGWYLQVGKDDDVSYIEPQGSSLAALRDDVSARRDDMYRALSALFLSGHSDALQAQSGASKSADWRALEVSLGVYHAALMSAMHRLTDVIGAAARLPLDTLPGVTGGDGWHIEDLATLMAAYPFLAAVTPPEDRAALDRKMQTQALAATGITLTPTGE